MNFEQVLNFIDHLIFMKTGKHLSNVQQLVLEAAWLEPRHCYEKIAQQGYSSSYLKQDVGPKLWRLLSDIFGEKIKKNNLRATVERLLVSRYGRFHNEINTWMLGQGKRI